MRKLYTLAASIVLLALISSTAVVFSLNNIVATSKKTTPTLDGAFIAATLGTTIAITNNETGVTTIVLVRQAPIITEPNEIIDNQFTLMNAIIEFKLPPAAQDNKTVYVMGDFDLLETEVNPVIQQMTKYNWTILNLHPHMKQEQPKLQFLHWQIRGNLNNILKQIQNVLSLTSIGQTGPITPQTALDTASIANALGGTPINGAVADVLLSRQDIDIIAAENPDIILNGFSLMGCAFEFIPFPPDNSQSDGNTEVFVMGDFALLESEVDAVDKALLCNNITGITMTSITGQHSHMLQETPKIMFVHFEAIGDLNQVIELINTAIDQTTIRGQMSLLEQGQLIFRFDTFGDEVFWGDALMLHEAIEGQQLGGVGPGVSPATALAVGLKVDINALPQSLQDQIAQGKVNLTDPATTVALLKLNAVVGIKGFFSTSGDMNSIGITCALCHSTVDDSFAPGIGNRLDGWPNRDLNVGVIISLAPNLKPIEDRLSVDEATVKTVLNSWGPGKFDAELLHDGIAFRPDNKSAATLIPPAFGMAGINLHTYVGWGSVPYWNAFVAVTEMQGQGRFYDPRLNNPVKFPLDAKFGTWNITAEPDLVTSKLAPLHLYQLSLMAPKPPPGSFNASAAALGDELFEGKAGCATCHTPPLYSEPGWSMHDGSEIGIDDFQANRSPDGMYRTTPLRGMLAHSEGGFFHDGRFATLLDVVNHYNTFFNLGLTEQEKMQLVEYLKSL